MNVTKLIFILTVFLLWGCEEKKASSAPDLPRGGDFVVPTTQGVFDTKNHRGKVIFLFFGFSQCPQVCPTTLDALRRFIKGLPEKERDQVEVLFVSVDDLRDSLKTLQEKLAGFPENFHGGMAPKSSLEKLLKQFGASYRIIRGTDPTDIIIDHTARIFMINRRGVWVDSLKYDSTPRELLTAYQTAERLSPVYSPHRRNRVVEDMGENKACDLSKEACEVNGYRVSIGPRPIVSEKEYEVRVSPGRGGTPVEVDFEGIDVNMGYIRPRLVKDKTGDYVGRFSIPTCEDNNMPWRARLILASPEGPKGLNFYFKTVIPGP